MSILRALIDLVVVRDHARQSTIEVLDAKTGGTLWKKNRDEPNAWATPRVLKHNGKTQVITATSNMVRSYDLNNGEIIWQCSGLTGNVIPCPVAEGDVVYCMSGYEWYSVLALPLSATGATFRSPIRFCGPETAARHTSRRRSCTTGCCISISPIRRY